MLWQRGRDGSLTHIRKVAGGQEWTQCTTRDVQHRCWESGKNSNGVSRFLGAGEGESPVLELLRTSFGYVSGLLCECMCQKEVLPGTTL